MKIKPRARNRRSSGVRTKFAPPAGRRTENYWQNRTGTEPPIAGSSLAELERRLNAATP